MEQQDKIKLRLSVSTMINASGFAALFVQRNCPQGLSVFLVIMFSLHTYELVEKLQIEVVCIITKIMSNISINTNGRAVK